MKNAKLIVILVLLALGAIVVFQNTESVQTNILFWSITMPRAILLPVTAAVGFVIGAIVCFRAKRGD